MATTFHIIEGHPNESRADFKSRIFDLCSDLSATDTISTVKVTLTENAPPAISIIPFSRKNLAAIRTTQHTSGTPEQLLSSESLRGTYLVEEAQPVSYDKDWPLGKRTPGVCLLTVFRQKQTIDRAKFLDRWYNGHTPLSLKIHPLWHYSRNEVVSAQNPKIMYDGIVEEHCRDREDLLNPFKFFGSPGVIVQNMIKVYRDVKSFIEYSSIETYLVAEYYFK